MTRENFRPQRRHSTRIGPGFPGPCCTYLYTGRQVSWELFSRVCSVPTRKENVREPESNKPWGEWWRRLAELAAVIALPPAIFYILGLGALWVQLSTEYGGPRSDPTWLASSLVSRSIAMSLGVQVALRALFWSLVVAAVLLFGLMLVACSRRLWRRYRRGSDYQSESISTIAVAALIAAGFSLTLWVGRRMIEEVSSIPTIRFYIVFLIIYFLLSYVSLSSFGGAGAFLKRVFASSPRWLYNTLALTSILIVGISVLFPGEPQLPCLWRQVSEGDVVDGEVLSAQEAEKMSRGRSLEGGFLGRSDGYWYVFDPTYQDLQAIPEDGARRFLAGEFNVSYFRIGQDGQPTGQPVTQEEMKSGEGYTARGNCN